VHLNLFLNILPFVYVLFFKAAAAASLDSSGAAPARRPPNHETDECDSAQSILFVMPFFCSQL
jgi:hypothetical protein